MAASLDVLAVHAQSMPENVAVIVDASGGGRTSTTTFAALNELVNACAHGLLEAGGRAGERLVWCGPNSLEVLVTIHAARKLGMVAVPLSYRFTADEMAYVIENSDATLVVTDAEQADSVMAAVSGVPRVRAVVVFGGATPQGARDWNEMLAAQPTTEPAPPENVSEAGAQMIYTSGTTGKPKGALRTRTDRSIVFALLAELGLGAPDDVHLTTGPLYHSGPLAFAAMSHTLGRPVVVLRKFDPVAWLRLVREHRITNTFSAPTQLKRIVSVPDAELASADMSTMRCLIANAAPVPYALKCEVVEKLGDGFLFEVYGSTELGVDTVLRPEDQLRKPGSCGKPYGGIEIKIVQDDGSVAPPGSPGELFVRTGLAMDGYHKTAEQLTELADETPPGARAQASGGSGEWKSVGDVAYVDDEGYVHICDRKKDMIISGGVNIYPAEIEAVLYAHPAVLDAAVFGVPDEEWGEAVHAVVQAKTDVVLDLDDLAAFSAERLAGYKRPRTWEQRDALPRTDSGKLLKRVLRDEHWQGRTSQV
ncbi:MAG TPA: AMP-binding protein [Acidimicrobiia bacterium]|jgi:acyl-CoA synthetase (AMP-forming)/AMP-acid ligase II